jgi:hypothetical protein
LGTPKAVYGKLDAATLVLFQGHGSYDLSCAEDWIADAESLAKLFNLHHRQLCWAFYQGTVGEVRAYLDTLSPMTNQDWSMMCSALLAEFSRESRKWKHREELHKMNRIAGLSIWAAIDRIKALIAMTGHPTTDLTPVWALMKEFPVELHLAVTTKGVRWKCRQQALGDLRELGRIVNEGHPDLQLVAKSEPKVEPCTPAIGPVTTTVSRPPRRNPTTMRCHRCGDLGHGYRQCTAKVIRSSSCSKNQSG